MEVQEAIDDVNPQPQPDLDITGSDSEKTFFGDVDVSARIYNRGDARGRATLYAQVSIEGGDTYTKSKRVFIDAGDYNDYTFEFDIPSLESVTGFSYEFETWLEK